MKGNHQQRGKMIKKEELNGFISGIQDVGLLLTSVTKPKKKKVGGKICTIEDGKTRFSYFIGQPDIQQKTTSKVQIKDGARTGPFSFLFFREFFQLRWQGTMAIFSALKMVQRRQFEQILKRYRGNFFPTSKGE